jgi:hypothetical protein
MRTWPFAVTATLVSLGAVWACSSSPAVTVYHARDGAHPPVEGDPVKLRRGPQAAFKGIEPGFHVVRSLEDWHKAWPPGRAPPMPRSVYESGSMVFVAVAEDDESVKLRVIRAVEDGRAVHVFVRETKNGEGCLLPKGDRFVADAVLTTRLEKPVRFYVDHERAESCGAPPAVAVKCRVNDGAEWAAKVAVQPGDQIDCQLIAEAPGRFAIVDRALTVGSVPGGSTAKLTYDKGPTRGTMSVDVFGTYAIRGEATDDSGRKAFADATIDALPAKSKEAVVQLVWTNFDAADEADTFPRLRLQASDPQAKPARVCWADQPIPGFCEVRTKSAYSYMTLRASEKKVPLAVAYLDERIQDGPLACVQVYFDGERTVETCDRQHRDAEERWEVGVLDMTTGKLVDPKAADAGAPAAAAPDEPAAPKKKPL